MSTSECARMRRIGFVSTRICGTDGVSLETGKWADVLEEMGYECYFIAGKCDRPQERSVIIEEAHFAHPAIEEINRRAFTSERRERQLTRDILEMSWHIGEQLSRAIRELDLDVVIAENCLTIPMNIPLGLALVNVLQETEIYCVAHHHDFYWERERFLVNSVDDFIRAAFPPPLPQIQHVVINTLAAEEFCRRTGLSCRVIPNVMDFAHPPPPPDDYARQFRQAIGLDEDDILVLQPTRVVARKGIEHSIELVRRLQDQRVKLVISHAAGDEGTGYAQRIGEYAELLGVPIIRAEFCVSDKRATQADGQKVFSIWDVYTQADLVTYPSTYEGFGNAFLESIYYKLPIVCNRYAIYRMDIEPFGFQTILLDGYLTDEVVDQVRRVLEDAELRQQMVEHNFEVGKQHFS